MINDKINNDKGICQRNRSNVVQQYIYKYIYNIFNKKLRVKMHNTSAHSCKQINKNILVTSAFHRIGTGTISISSLRVQCRKFISAGNEAICDWSAGTFTSDYFPKYCAKNDNSLSVVQRCTLFTTKGFQQGT